MGGKNKHRQRDTPNHNENLLAREVVGDPAKVKLARVMRVPGQP